MDLDEDEYLTWLRLGFYLGTNDIFVMWLDDRCRHETLATYLERVNRADWTWE